MWGGATMLMIPCAHDQAMVGSLSWQDMPLPFISIIFELQASYPQMCVIS
jgi:hypothetical protein